MKLSLHALQLALQLRVLRLLAASVLECALVAVVVFFRQRHALAPVSVVAQQIGDVAVLLVWAVQLIRAPAVLRVVEHSDFGYTRTRIF